jgi:nucleotide-binding universal stress UspA family protein
MFQHILLPTDGSRLSEKSVKHGVGMAKVLKASVTALHVTPRFYPFNYEMGLLESTRGDFVKASEASARKYLDFVKSIAMRAGVKCDVVHATGDQPFKEIIKTAQKKKCDLILMASHGRHGIEGFLLGSETQKVLTHSRIPVLVYR